jgi:hypothetical protein
MSEGTWINGVKQSYFSDVGHADLVWREDYAQHMNFYEI